MLDNSPRRRWPVFSLPVSVAVVVIVLTGGVLTWQLLLTPRVVPGHATAGGSVVVQVAPSSTAASSVTAAQLALANKMIQSRVFLHRLRTALPEEQALLALWTARNTRFTLNQTIAGQIRLDYAAPGYSIRVFDWQNFAFHYVGTQHAPSQDLANELTADHRILAQQLAKQAAKVLAAAAQ